MPKTIVPTPGAPPATGPYSPVVACGDLLFLSGQIPLDSSTGEPCHGAIENQARLIMSNIGSILADAGSSWDKVLKVTIYLGDMDDFARVNEVYRTFFAGGYPARTCVQVAGLPFDAGLEIEVIACR